LIGAHFAHVLIVSFIPVHFEVLRSWLVLWWAC